MKERSFNSYKHSHSNDDITDGWRQQLFYQNHGRTNGEQQTMGKVNIYLPVDGHQNYAKMKKQKNEILQNLCLQMVTPQMDGDNNYLISIMVKQMGNNQ